MTGPICFAWNDLSMELWHLVVRRACRKMAEMAVLRMYFKRLSTGVHSQGWNTRHESFVADCCVRERSRQRTSCVRGRPVVSAEW